MFDRTGRRATECDGTRRDFDRRTGLFLKKDLHLRKKCDILRGAKKEYAPLAQMDRAQASDAWCRRFESAMVRQRFPHALVAWGNLSCHGVYENRTQKIACDFSADEVQHHPDRPINHTSLAPKFGSDPPWCAKDSPMPLWRGGIFRAMVSMRTVRKKSHAIFLQTRRNTILTDPSTTHPLRRSSVLIRHGAPNRKRPTRDTYYKAGFTSRKRKKEYGRFVRTPFHTPCPARYSVLHL